MPQRNSTAMLDCQDSENEGDNCTHCHTASGDNRLYWGIQLDQDLLETIVGIYPEWFKDCSMNLAVPRPDGMEDNDKVKPTIIPLTPDSKVSSKADMENSTLQKAMERNKESLKVKLMLRRPINQLIDQGILPPLKPPSTFHDERQKLERARMGDLLKSKIQKRPDRQALIQQHILEDTSADPSLHEKQRMLKKARLVDGLNNQISHRPGPLELVKGNILQADEVLAQAVREGSIQFQSVREDSPPLMKNLPEDDSSSECASPSPPYSFSEHSQGSFPSLEASEASPTPMNNSSPYSARTSFSMSPPSSVSSPLSIIPSVVSPQSQSDQMPELILNGLLLQSKETPVKNRKKAKPKTQPKARTIKFHEYKGPPNAQKNVQSSASNNATAETSYDLLLHQQQLFLQWQLEWQQKYPQSVLPSTTQVTNGDQTAQTSQTVNSTNPTIPHLESPNSPQKVITKLEDLKVSDLKAELKKRNLPVSGPKPILIERLKCYAESSQNRPITSCSSSVSNKTTTPSPSPAPVNIGGILLDTLPSIPAPSSDIDISSFDLNNVQDAEMPSDIYDALESDNQQSLPSQANNSLPIDIEPSICQEVAEVSDPAIINNEAIVQFQQRCIEKLQMELQRSQLQLQQTMIGQQPQETTGINEETPLVPIAQSLLSSKSAPVPPPPANTVVSSAAESRSVPTVVTVQSMDVKNKLRQRQLIHQQLQQKIHQQSLLLRQRNNNKEPQAVTKASETNPSTNANSALTALLKSEPIQSPVEINLNSVPDIEDEAVSTVAAYPSITSQIDENDFSHPEELMKPFPGVVPLYLNPTPTSTNSSSSSGMAKSMAGNGQNGVVAQRTSSLPSFSALVNNKPAATRSNTDPLFLMNKPPPNYNEATRQLNKMKQQLLQSHDYGNGSRQPKKLKSSMKCQAVDDVLEILIKNGELPPSAAHEPQSPTTPIPKRKLSSPPSYQKPTLTSSSAITMSTNSVTSPIVSSVTPLSASCDGEPPSVNLHLSSLQSVLDMTPPSSAGFGEPNNNTPSSLDFDFHLDVEDIEVMDLEGLSHEEPQTLSLDPSLATNLSKTLRNARHPEQSHIMTNINGSNDLMDYQTRGMDADIIEWLELLGDSAGMTTNSCSSPNFHHPSYSIQSERDPMLSNIGNSRDTLDFFGVDDMDFKANEVSILSWDKSDFTT